MDDSRFSAQVGLSALGFLFGWQALRSLIPLLSFLGRARLDWDIGKLTGLSLALFAASFVALPVRRWLGRRRFLAASAVGLGLARLALQLWAGDPLGELVLALTAMVFFFFFLAARVLDAHAQGPPALTALATGCWLGLTLDTALHGACDTYDLSWHAGVPGVLVIVMLAAAGGRFLVLGSGRETLSAETPVPGPPSWTWVGFGAFLFLQIQEYQNIARLTALTGWSQALSFGWILAAHVLGLVLLLTVAARSRLPVPATVLGLLVLAQQAAPWWAGPAAAWGLLAGQAVNGCWLAYLVKGLGAGGPGRPRPGLSHGAAMIATIVFVLLYYADYEIALPYENATILRAAALVMAVCVVGAGYAIGKGTGGAILVPARGRLIAVASVFLAVPVYKALAAPAAELETSPALPIKVMTYNVQFGFDVRCHLGLEELARVIEKEDPDVVTLQEVGRGWLIAGSTDLPEWLGRRLGMTYVFGPAADPLMGNAVLTRLPVVDFEVHDLPSEGLALRRSLVSVKVDVGEASPLEVISAHFHHTRSGGPVREKQARAVVDFWQGRSRTVFAGDLNAEPDHPEIEILRRAGLADGFLAGGGAEPGYTFSSVRPVRRIDYIRISPDLVASEATVLPDQTSDHRAVVAWIGTK